MVSVPAPNEGIALSVDVNMLREFQTSFSALSILVILKD